MNKKSTIFGVGSAAALVTLLGACEGRTPINMTDGMIPPDSGITMQDSGSDTTATSDSYVPAQCRPLCNETQSVKIARSGDVLTLNELLGEVIDSSVSSLDTPALASSMITTPSGSYRADQHLQFTWTEGQNVIKANVKPLFGKDDDDNIGDFLWFKDSDPAFRFFMEFYEDKQGAKEHGIKSKVSPDGKLADIVGISLDILGEQFIVYDANLSGTGTVKLGMKSCASGKTLLLQDSDPGQEGGRVEVGGVWMEDGKLNINYALNSEGITIHSIAYTMLTDGKDGDEPYLKPGEGLRQKLGKPDSMLASPWNIIYKGMSKPQISSLFLKRSGDDEYRLSFTNTQGLGYGNIRLAAAVENGVRYGDDDDALVFQQGADKSDPANFTIQKNDYLVLSHNGVTRVLRFDSVDTSNSLAMFTDVGTGGTLGVQYNSGGPLPQCAQNMPNVGGTISSGGFSYGFALCADPTATGKGLARMLVDLDGDGSLGGKANIYFLGGGVLDLGSQSTSSPMTPVAGPLELKLITPKSKIDEATSDESIGLDVYVIQPGKLDAAPVQNLSAGLNMQSDGNNAYGMSNYGVGITKDLGTGTVEIEYPHTQRLPQAFVVFSGQCSKK
ncbi:hypothetical protein KY363_01735 [Candidatus Woesearchaeota archaeon]|nr:hypothetical protein [Candidatus Woesearchaeota archaeon]